jgi:methylglutaconyl-CoA hydratase
VGLVAAADIALAAEGTVFSLAEVKLGILPSVISPYVLRAIGARQARDLFLTGDRFDAREALRIGLVHGVATAADLEAAAK